MVIVLGLDGGRGAGECEGVSNLYATRESGGLKDWFQPSH